MENGIGTSTFTVNISHCQYGFYALEYKLTVKVYLNILRIWTITKVVKKHTFIEFWGKIQFLISKEIAEFEYY
jgi:hypothetical protein